MLPGLRPCCSGLRSLAAGLRAPPRKPRAAVLPALTSAPWSPAETGGGGGGGGRRDAPHASREHRLRGRRRLSGAVRAAAAPAVSRPEFQSQLEKMEERVHMSVFMYKHSYVCTHMKHGVKYVD